MSSERTIAYVLGTFPQASQTFIAREVRGLRSHGVPLLVFALARRPPDVLEPPDRSWYDDVRFVPLAAAPSVLAANLHFLVRDPARYMRELARLVRLPHRPAWLALRAVVLFMSAAWIARSIERAGGCRQVHAHFALAQTEVAMAVSGLLGCPFSFTAHARDIYATPSALEAKIRGAAVVVTCTDYNVRHLRRLCPDVPAEHIQLVHHGVDIAAAGRAGDMRAERHASETRPPLILAAGRLIEKKGFDTLLDACGLLAARGIPFHCRIVGTGPMLGDLRARARALGLGTAVDFPGWLAAERLLDQMADASLFTMPSRVAKTGDRDGIPNVVLEAMATGLPVVATHVSGIPEAVINRETGLLVEPDDPAGLAEGLALLLTDRQLATAFGDAGRRHVLQEFALDVASVRLSALFGFGAATDLR